MFRLFKYRPSFFFPFRWDDFGLSGSEIADIIESETLQTEIFMTIDWKIIQHCFLPTVLKLQN
jgi:hypothetical protein